MKLKEALDNKLLRVVELNTNNYPKPYKDVPETPYMTLIGKKVAIINIQARFLYVKEPRLKGRTLTTKTGMSLVDVNGATIDYDTIKKPARNQFIAIELTQALLSQEIVTWQDAEQDVHNLTFDELMTNVLLKKPLSDEEVLSIALDPRTDKVLPLEDQVKLTKHVVTLEILAGKTARGRLFKEVFHTSEHVPRAMQLFSEDEQAILKKAVVLQ
jgi:hypothetical protein